MPTLSPGETNAAASSAVVRRERRMGHDTRGMPSPASDVGSGHEMVLSHAPILPCAGFTRRALLLAVVSLGDLLAHVVHIEILHRADHPVERFSRQRAGLREDQD